MEKRFLHCLHSQWGMVENDVRAFDGFIDRDGRPTIEPSRWPKDVRQRWRATKQGVDYVHSQTQGDYTDAWILPDADLCVDVSDGGHYWVPFFHVGPDCQDDIDICGGSECISCTGQSHDGQYVAHSKQALHTGDHQPYP